ncbi:hypothetical protein DBV15_05727 [Temnothorax longispinosus]|uniref:Uncharacterized protein n=1 Tax=Temnothorax longispinosus TaxID=300112 RepID=A0A4S2KF46_9HYME|nr:hypothetical protein DBV15_05727 [Temnothorax longispinosus]
MVVGAQRSCWWLFHFHRAVFWPDRTPRSRPAPARKTVVSSPLSAVPPKNRTGIFPDARHYQFSLTRCSYLSFVIAQYTCEFAFQVPVDVRTVDFMRD